MTRPLDDLRLTSLASHGLRGSYFIFRRLSLFGRERPTEEEILRSHFYWNEDHINFFFAESKIDKLYGARLFGWDREACRSLRGYHKSVDLEFLEAFCWDDFIGTFLILYHPIQGTFWGYSKSDYILPTEQLIELGGKWTDVILRWPCAYFNKKEREGRLAHLNAKTGETSTSKSFN